MTGAPAQLALDLGHRPAQGRDAYLVSPANAEAVAMVEAWENWPGGKLTLSGEPGTGKSHLARVWADLAGARILEASALDPSAQSVDRLAVENVERIAGDPVQEEALFHVHNALMSRGGRLLLTGRGAAPRDWGLTLPDLVSRIQAAGAVRLGPPDEALLAGVLVKLFADRQIRATPRLVEYLLRRIDRSFAAAQEVVARIDEAALANRKPVGIQLAKTVLGDID